MLFEPVPRISTELRAEPGTNQLWEKTKKVIKSSIKGNQLLFFKDSKISTHYLPKGGKHPLIFLPGFNREQRYEAEMFYKVGESYPYEN